MQDSLKTNDPRSAIRRLVSFVIVAVLLAVVAFSTPLRDYLNIDEIQNLADRLGAWGPVAIVGVSLVSPLLFLPRWPVAVVSGLLYGVGWGAALATVAATFGASVQFVLARHLLAPAAQRALARLPFLRGDIPPRRTFMIFLFLRAFPLSNFVVTNLAAGALRVRWPIYLATCLIGMLPSSFMYAACGRTVNRPHTGVYLLAIGGILLIAVSGVIVQRWVWPRIRVNRED